MLELVGGAPGGETPQKLELAYRHTRIWQAETAGKLLAASARGRCTRKSQQLVTAGLIRKLLRPLRVLAALCNLAAFTQRRCRCIAVGCGVSNGATSSIANEKELYSNKRRAAQQCAFNARRRGGCFNTAVTSQRQREHRAT